MRQSPVRLPLKALCSPLLAAALATLGCHAQPPAGGVLSPDLARRVEILIRTRAKLPPDYVVKIGSRTASDNPGFDTIQVTFAQNGEPSKPVPFLLSKDGKTLAQFNQYDISQDPKSVISGHGRPARGGPEGAPVEIVAFDDLECPFCSKMHEQIFPALGNRYGDKVRIVYRDLPISQHPWAMRAAIDVNCVAAQSPVGYWNLVDYIHSHAPEFGGEEKSLKKATDTLDQIALDEARKDKLKTDEVNSCIQKQDENAIRASMKIAEDLNVGATPVLFINGEKFEGAYPLVDLFRMIDSALVAAGQTPPPPYSPPAPTTPSAKPGS